MNADELYQKGFEARCDGRYGEAKLFFQAVLGEQPDHVDANWQCALIKGFEGDFDGSLADLQGLCDRYPTHNDIRYDLAMTMMMLGMNDEACAEFNRILSSDPTHDKTLQQIVYCP